MNKLLRLVLVSLLTTSFALTVKAETAAIAIIIDDLGNNLSVGKRIINSNWPIACSILPQRPFSIQLANLANKEGKEVMVHLPMEAKNNNYLGYGALSSTMTEEEFELSINSSIDAIPHAKGVNNHMGSLLTQQTKHMELFMQTLANRDDHLYFIDSRTTSETVARQMASEYFIPNLERDVFLDAINHDEQFVRHQMQRLFAIAQKQGYALAIGHPSKITLSVLEDELSKLDQTEIQLVSVETLIKLANKRTKKETWQTYSSLSPKVAKN